ncbi:MAG TPA: acyloxyacyl hydrolase [Nitrospiraceae bacterium]|nr:acyloxyacyl hydrolase [Nitrospiraceae bacterium]
MPSSLSFIGSKKANLPRLEWVRLVRSSCLIVALATPGLFILIHGKSIAGDITLLSIGPRYGFTREEPLLGKRQTEQFDLVDVAATFRLPWSWPLGESPWSVETRLITSAGALSAAGHTGLIAAAMPNVALSGWRGFVSIDAGVGLGFFGRDTYGAQDFGGHVQLVLTAALQIHPISHAFAGFRLQHFSDAGIYGSDSLGLDFYIIEVGYRF